MKDDKLYLIHISECIERIKNYTPNNKEIFFRDTKTQDAVLRNLHTLTESIQHISNNLKKQYPEIDWRAISAFRNVVVHDYLGIDIERVWDIINRDLSDLESKIKVILDQLS